MSFACIRLFFIRLSVCCIMCVLIMVCVYGMYEVNRYGGHEEENASTAIHASRRRRQKWISCMRWRL